MWTAKITDTRLVNGVMQVTVEYSCEDGNIFTDTITSTQKQGEEWPNSIIQDRLKHLSTFPEKIAELDARKEEVIAPVVERRQDEQMGQAKKEYKEKLAIFHAYVVAISRGFTGTETQDFLELKGYLTDNFKPEYLDLFGT